MKKSVLQILQEGIDVGMITHISKIFGIFITEYHNRGSALDRFTDGVDKASEAYEEANDYVNKTYHDK